METEMVHSSPTRDFSSQLSSPHRGYVPSSSLPGHKRQASVSKPSSSTSSLGMAGPSKKAKMANGTGKSGNGVETQAAGRVNKGKRRARQIVVSSEDSQSESDTTPKAGKVATGMPMASKGPAYHKFQAILNDKSTTKTPKRAKKATPKSSPDPIDSISGASDPDDDIMRIKGGDTVPKFPGKSAAAKRAVKKSTPRLTDSPDPLAIGRRRAPSGKSSMSSPERPKSLKSRTINGALNRTVSKPEPSDKGATKSSQLVRNSSLGDISGASDNNSTPKARKALPSFKKKWDKQYTADEFQRESEQAQIKKELAITNLMFSNPGAFMASGDSPLMLPEARKKQIEEESRRRLEKQAEEEENEARELREQQRKQREASNAVNSFFANAPDLPAQPKLRSVRSEEDRMMLSLSTESPDKTENLMSLSLSPTAARQDREDQMYLAKFRDFTNPCTFCNAPLPKKPSEDLQAIKVLLQEQQHPERHQIMHFCSMHRAETEVLPLGWRSNYPNDLDFERLEKRVERGFIRTRLRRVAEEPDLSRIFRTCAKQIKRGGYSAWRALTAQSSAARKATPGYYGPLGQKILLQHFQQLHQWGLLPSLSTHVIQPLSITDFIVLVLVPEAVTLLVMADNGWTSTRCKGTEWNIARDAAIALRKESADYGIWRFREDTAEGQAVLDKLSEEEHVAAKRGKLEKKRDEEEAMRKNAPRNWWEQKDEPIEIPSSDASREPSEYGADDVFWDEALKGEHKGAHKAEHEEAAASPCAGKRTKFKLSVGRTQSQSSVPCDSWDDKFCGEAVAQLDAHQL